MLDSTGRSTSKGKPTLTKKKKRGDIQATTKVVDFRSLKSSPPKIQFIFPIFSNNRFLKAIYFLVESRRKPVEWCWAWAWRVRIPASLSIPLRFQSSRTILPHADQRVPTSVCAFCRDDCSCQAHCIPPITTGMSAQKNLKKILASSASIVEWVP